MNEADHNPVMKAAEDPDESGLAADCTPKPCGGSGAPKIAPAFWSAAVLCRFFWALTAIGLAIGTGLWLNSALAAKKAAPHLESDPSFTTVVDRINLAFENSWQEA